MSNLVRIHGNEMTPIELFRNAHPKEAERLKGSITRLAKCSDHEAGLVIQEIINSIHRVAKGQVNG